MGLELARLSCLVKVGMLLVGPSALICLSLGAAKWGALALALETVDDPKQDGVEIFYRTRPVSYPRGPGPHTE